jgi:enoyl-CoA hydratase/carnithine racemase
MYQALVEACDQAEADSDIRVFILRGAGGKAFVAGTDIGQFREFRTREDGIAYEARLDEVLDRLERVTKPTIAQVGGIAAGAGCAIAMTCDLRLCTPDARFGVPIARTLGNCLSAATYSRFLDLIGPARLKEIMFTGRFFDAAEAAAAGLVNRIVDADRIDAAVREIAQTIAANAPLTIKASKEMVRRLQARRRIASQEGHDLIAMCYASDDFKEGVEAFLAKRAPQWKGV